jgi:hypothetical protein
MEKPWMANLVETLQARPTKESADKEIVSAEPAAPAPATSESPGEINRPSVPPKAEPVSQQPRTAAPVSDNFHFSGGTGDRWSPPAKPPLEVAGSNYWNESWSDRIVSHAPGITLAVLFVLALGALSFFYRVQAGQLLVRLGEKVSGEPTESSALAAPNATASPVQPTAAPIAPASPQQPVSAPNSSPSPSTASAADTALAANPNVAASSAAGLPENPTSVANGSSSPAAGSGSRADLARPRAGRLMPAASSSSDLGQSDFQAADASLRQARTPEARARAAELLWAAVSKGSSDAEVELADVYGRGEGVHKNCMQARILLAAARDKNNPLVARESSELRVYGCR